MKIYTRNGDKGFTYDYTGKKVNKSSNLCIIMGKIDELSSYCGYARITCEKKEQDFFIEIGKILFQIMSYIGGAKNTFKNKEKVLESIVKKMEEKIDSYNIELKSFILPFGEERETRLHILRTKTRLLETRISNIEEYEIFLPFINRLSDYCFALAVKYAKESNTLQTISRETK